MKTGLVLEGGAMRGIYTAGVLDAFLEQDIKVDGVIGVSAGAVHGCSYVHQQHRSEYVLCHIFFLPQKRNAALCMERIPHCHWSKRCTITHLLLLNYILIKKHADNRIFQTIHIIRILFNILINPYQKSRI